MILQKRLTSYSEIKRSKMQKQVAIYARVSSKKQQEDETIQSQVAALCEYAQKHGYNVPNGWIFTDDGVTGSILNRPALNALRELIFEEVVDTVLVYSPDRLSRKYAYQIVLEMEFQKKGVDLIFLNTPKATTPEEQFSAQFKGIFAEYERVQIAERCKRGRLHQAKQGSVSTIPVAPLGYDYNKKAAGKEAQYTINEDARTVRLIFELYVRQHYSMSQICRRLEEDGILSPKGLRKWSTTTVRDILKNQAYIGVAYFGKTEVYSGVPDRIYRNTQGKKTSSPINARKERPEEHWIPIKVPQIISESDFESAQLKIQENKRMAARNTKKPSILQGLLVCGHCKGSYYKKDRGNKNVYYYCGKALRGSTCCGMPVRANEIEEAVWGYIIELLSNPRVIENEIKRRMAENQDPEGTKERLKEIEKEIERLSRAKDKLLDAYQEGDCITLEALKIRMKGIDTKIATVIFERRSLERFLEIEKKEYSLKATLERFQGLLEKADELSVKEKQNVLRLLVEEIVIADNELEIRHCIPCQEADTEFGPLRSDGYIVA